MEEAEGRGNSNLTAVLLTCGLGECGAWDARRGGTVCKEEEQALGMQPCMAPCSRYPTCLRVGERTAASGGLREYMWTSRVCLQPWASRERSMGCAACWGRQLTCPPEAPAAERTQDWNVATALKRLRTLGRGGNRQQRKP